MTHRQSYPVRSRSSEEFIAVNSPPLDDRKKSHTSTQSTTIDTPPKSPPHYGNTLTVDPPELSEAITGFIDEPVEQSSPKWHPIVHRESEEFEIDDIDNVLASLKQKENKERMVNGNARPGSPSRPETAGRPGTPVKKNHAVRFVKPTLTVTLNTDSGGMVNESFDEEAQEDENENEEHKKNVETMPPVETAKYSRRRAARSAGLSSITDLQTHRT